MKIELKNLKHFSKISNETNAFVADVYVDGIKTAHAENNGGGAETSMFAYVNQHERFNNAKLYCLSLPKTHSDEFDFDFNTTLDYMVDKLVCDDLVKKEQIKMQKRFEKDMEKGICLGTFNEYKICYWKNYTISKLLEFETGRLMIQKKIKELKNQNYNILNTNIPQELL